jgi:HD-like signal output (HDOD) protein
MLGGLFGGGKNKQADTGPAKLSPTVLSSILNLAGSRGVPSMPGNAQKAFKLATDPNAEARDFVDVIEADEALAARIIKIANSVFFDRGHASKTIPEAVTVIGINELKCVLNASSLTALFPSNHIARTQLWANDIATALITRQLAQRLMPESADGGFLAGLMHDIGKLLMLQRAADDYVKILKRVEQEGCDFRTAEQEAFVCDHTEVGQLIAERWNFTKELTAAIRQHHEPWLEGAPPTLARLVYAADTLAHSLGIGHPRGWKRFQQKSTERLEELWPQLQVTAGERQSFLNSLRRTYESEREIYEGRGS